MKALRIVVASAWLVVGVALGVPSVFALVSEWKQADRGGVVAGVIFVAFSTVSIGGGIVALRSGRRGPPILYVSSVLALLYAASYWLFGGVEDTGWLTAILVSALALFSLFTLVAVRRDVSYAL